MYAEALDLEDMQAILAHLHAKIPPSGIKNIVRYTVALHDASAVSRKMGREGAPWEFNLRDAMRWCELAQSLQPDVAPTTPDETFVPLLRRTAEIVYISRFRSESDRMYARRLFAEVFAEDACEAAIAAAPQPELVMDQQTIACGGVVVGRSVSYDVMDRGVPDAALVSTQLAALPAMLACVKHSWMCLLTGQSGVGKTSLVRILARLMGKTLTEVSIGPGTDVNDLLGSFEQQTERRELQHLTDLLRRVVSDVAMHCARGIDEHIDAAREAGIALQGVYEIACAASPDMEAPLDARAIVRACEALSSHANAIGIDVPDALDRELRRISEAAQALADSSLRSSSQGESDAQPFTWVDGPVVRAMERGEWLLLDNANLCNPAVLDRLNSLLDQGAEGALLLNESGDAQRVLRMRRGFQLFLALNPRASSGSAVGGGELSRAMRNRGVEVTLAKPFRQEDAARMLVCATDVPLVPSLVGALAVHVARDEKDIASAARAADAAAVLVRAGHPSERVYAIIAGCSPAEARSALKAAPRSAVPLGTWPVRRGVRALLFRAQFAQSREAALRDLDALVAAGALTVRTSTAFTDLDRARQVMLDALPIFAGALMLTDLSAEDPASPETALHMLIGTLRTYMQRTSNSDGSIRLRLLGDVLTKASELLESDGACFEYPSRALALIEPLARAYASNPRVVASIDADGDPLDLAPALIPFAALASDDKASLQVRTGALQARTLWDAHVLREWLNFHDKHARVYMQTWRRSLDGRDPGARGATLLHAALHRRSNPLDEATFEAVCAALKVHDVDRVAWIGLLVDALDEALQLLVYVIGSIRVGAEAHGVAKDAYLAVVDLSSLVHALASCALSGEPDQLVWRASFPAFHWARALPRLARLEQLADAQAKKASASCCFALGQALGVVSAGDAPLLWRKGGRAHLSPNAAINSMEAEARALASTMSCASTAALASSRDSWREAVEYLSTPADMRGDVPAPSATAMAWTHFDSEVRKTLVESVCLFDHARAYSSDAAADEDLEACVNWDADPDEARTGDVAAAAPDPEALGVVMQSLRKLKEAPTTSRGNSSMLLTATAFADPTSQACATVLLALLERRALSAQLEVEADVAELATGAAVARNSELAEAVRISARAGELSEFLVACTASPLLDVAPLHQFMHLVHNAATAASRMQDDEYRLEAMLPHVSHELRYRTQVTLSSRLCDAFLWRASQSMRFGSGGRARRLIAIASRISSEADGVQSDGVSASAVAGDAFLFTLLPSVAEGRERLGGLASVLVNPAEALLMSYAHTSVAAGAVVVAELEHAMAVLRRLRRALLVPTLRNRGEGASTRGVRSVARRLIHILAHVLAIYAPTYVNEASRERVMECARELHRLGHNNTDESSEVATASSHLISIMDETATGASEHAAFARSATPVLRRVAAELPALAQLAKTGCPSGWSALSTIGVASMCMGVALATLAAPPLHGDPVGDLHRGASSLRAAAKHALDIELPLEQKNMDPCVLPGAPGASEARVRAGQWQRAAKWWCHRADALESGASARVDESTYLAFATESRRVLDSSLNPSYALGLLGDKHGSDAEAKAAALLSWCASLEAYAESCEHRHGNLLRDVMQPMLLGVREAASGARTLALHLSASQRRREADGVLISLMAYPCVPFALRAPNAVEMELDLLCTSHATQLCEARGMSAEASPSALAQATQRERDSLILSVQRATLVAAARDVQMQRKAAVFADWDGFEALLMSFVRAWERVQERKEEEAARASSLFQVRPHKCWASLAIDLGKDARLYESQNFDTESKKLVEEDIAYFTSDKLSPPSKPLNDPALHPCLALTPHSPPNTSEPTFACISLRINGTRCIGRYGRAPFRGHACTRGGCRG